MYNSGVKLRVLSMNLAFLLLFFYLGCSAFGDTCSLRSVIPAKSMNEQYVVSAQFNREAGKWKYLWEDTKNSKTLTGYLQAIESHAHLYFFITADGSRFAVLNARAGHRLNERLLIYDSSGELVRAFGLEDLLTKRELKKVTYSESHIRWLKYDQDTTSYGKYDSKKDLLKLISQQNRRIFISLVKGKMLKKED